MRKPKRPKYRQFDLWGNLIPLSTPKPPATVTPLEFEAEPMRLSTDKNETWFSITDICMIAGVSNVGTVLRRLEDDEKRDDIVSNDVTGRPQKMWFVSEGGMYSVLTSFRLRKDNPNYEKLRRFRRWVTHEVLPSIRKTGSYTARPTDRIATIQRSLKCDARTAKNRDEQRVTNVTCHADLRASGAKRKQFQDWNNAPYEGMYGGMKAADLRRTTKRKGTPLNWSDGTNIAVNTLSKTLALRAAQENGIPLADRPALLRQIAHEVARSSLDQLGSDFAFGITEHPKRGRILDVVRVQLSAPGQN